MEMRQAIANPRSAIRIHASHAFAMDALRDELREQDVAVELKYCGSEDALASLAHGGCDLAGFHTPIGELESAVLERWRRWLQPRARVLMGLVTRRQGILVALGNPHRIASLADLTRPGLRFAEQRIEDVDGEWDLIFSNAALHWVANHRALFPRLMKMLKPAGQLVVQMPSNWEHPSQVVLRELGKAELGWKWNPPTLGINEYGELLWKAGGGSMTICEKLYCHEMPSSDEIAEWMRGTALVPYLERVAAGEREGFFQRYRERLRAHLPKEPVFFGFRRILIAATKET